MSIDINNTNAGKLTLNSPVSGTTTITFPSTAGTSGQALTTDGVGNLSFATVGGLTGFTAAESTSAPNATVYVDSLTASAASTNADVAFVAKGTGATLAQVPDSTNANGNKRGQYATDWQKFRNLATQVASGTGSTIVGGQGNQASGSNSIAGGYYNLASGSNAVALGGQSNGASGQNSVIVGGSGNSATNQFSFAAGRNNTSDGELSVVIGGYYGRARGIKANFVVPASEYPAGFTSGGSQSATLILGRQTTDATATRLTNDTNSAQTTNQVILPNNSAYYFRGSITAGVTGGGNSAMWSFEGGIKRGAGATFTTLIQSVINQVAADAGASTWAVALTADIARGGLAVTVTGQAATTIRWVCKIETTEMTY